MVTAVLEFLGSLIIAAISSGGYGAVMLLMAIESACIPLPSEIIMPFSGYLVSVGRFNLGAVAVVGALGCNMGSLVAYYVGARGGRRLVEKYGRLVLISQHDLGMADRFFERYGDGAVFLARMLPVVRTFIALPAGIARMNQIKFHLYTFVGSLPWCLALVSCRPVACGGSSWLLASTNGRDSRRVGIGMRAGSTCDCSGQNIRHGGQHAREVAHVPADGQRRRVAEARRRRIGRRGAGFRRRDRGVWRRHLCDRSQQ